MVKIREQPLEMLEQELEFLKFYKHDVIDDLSSYENKQYGIKSLNQILLEEYLKICDKYKTEIFDFELGEWYESYLKNRVYEEIVDSHFISFYIEQLEKTINHIKFIIKNTNTKNKKYRIIYFLI